MTQFPFENAAALRIGSVQYVAPNELKVTLDIETPASVALNTGLPRPFPRVNGYVLVSADNSYLVGQIEWITIEPASYPKRKGMSDFGIIDLPYPTRKMKIAPLGALSQNIQATQPKKNAPEHSQNIQEYDYIFTRGVKVFPSVGADVLLPTDEQLKAIIQSGKHRRIKIGTCPLADNADVHVDPDRLFGRHLAVLGNTGSGKSCSVAGLIKWSLREASTENKKNEKPYNPNARFIILDPNGEYAKAFQHESGIGVKIFSTAVDEKCEKYLRVPMWLWNNEEWLTFTQAAPKTQKPILINALREVKNITAEGVSENTTLSTNDDAPKHFKGEDLLAKVKELANKPNVKYENISTLITRIQSILSNSRIRLILDDYNHSLEDWLTTYIGPGQYDGDDIPSVTIIDLSLVPTEIIHTVIAVTARMTLESLQRHHKIDNGNSLPTVLVMEEAHTFIKRYKEDAEDHNAATICCQVFEKIAREGRKFGLGLVVSSQRPSELSPTVLSQCNSFLIHRISNDRDQETVTRLVSDNLRGLLRELPSLPSQNAILLGWATELPTLVKINDLSSAEQPASSDPEFWKVWTHQEERKSHWKEIAEDWQGGSKEQASVEKPDSLE